MADNIQQRVLMIVLILTSIITLAAVAANLGLFGESELVSNFAKWGLTGVLGVIVTTAVGISKGLFSKTNKLRVSITFKEKQPGEVRLDTTKCEYQLLDDKGNEIEKNKLTPVIKGQNWECTLPEKAIESFYVKLFLSDLGGVNWIVGPFYSFESTQIAEVTG
jgi:hypothetical protein